MLLRSPRKAVPCPAFVKEQDPRVTAVPKKSGGGKVGKRGYSARRFLLFVRDIFPGGGSPTPARGPTCEIQCNLRSPPARYTRRRKTLPALTYKRRLQALIWACMPYFKASERHLEPRTSSGRAWPVASKPWHTPDRQQLVRARSSGKAARQGGQKDFRKDPSSGRPPQLHAGSLPCSRQDAALPSAGRVEIHTEPPPHPVRAQNPVSPHPPSSISPSIDCRTRTLRQRAPRAWKDAANP